MNNEEALADFRRRWESTYVWLKMKHKGVETLVFVRQVESDQSKVGVLHLDSAEYGSMTINLGSSDHTLSFRYPKSGVFQYGQNAYLYRRRPARQWRRGICVENSTLGQVMRPFGARSAGVTIDSVAAAFKGVTHSKNDAIERLYEHRVRSVALGNNLSIALSAHTTPEYFVMYWDNLVARCNDKGALTKVYEKVMEPALSEVFNG